MVAVLDFMVSGITQTKGVKTVPYVFTISFELKSDSEYRTFMKFNYRFRNQLVVDRDNSVSS